MSAVRRWAHVHEQLRASDVQQITAETKMPRPHSTDSAGRLRNVSEEGKNCDVREGKGMGRSEDLCPVMSERSSTIRSSGCFFA